MLWNPDHSFIYCQIHPDYPSGFTGRYQADKPGGKCFISTEMLLRVFLVDNYPGKSAQHDVLHEDIELDEVPSIDPGTLLEVVAELSWWWMHNPVIDICRTILNIEQFLFSVHPYLERLLHPVFPISMQHPSQWPSTDIIILQLGIPPAFCTRHRALVKCTAWSAGMAHAPLPGFLINIYLQTLETTDLQGTRGQ